MAIAVVRLNVEFHVLNEISQLSAARVCIRRPRR